MKVGKYLEVISKIDTDNTMDENIKNKLLSFHEKQVDPAPAYHQRQDPYRNRRRVILHTFSKVSVIKQALPSIAFLAFLVVAILSVRASIYNERELIPSSDMEAQKETDLEINETSSDKVSNLPAMISFAPMNQLQTDILQAADDKTGLTASDSAEDNTTLGEDTVESVTNHEMNVNLSNYFNPEDADNTVAATTSDTTSEVEVKEAEASITETSKISETEGIEADASQDNSLTGIEEEEEKAVGDFYFAWFDVTVSDNVKSAIPNLIIRLHGTVDHIDPIDLTDVVLTKDGVSIANGITLTDKVVRYSWRYEDITDFYFAFDHPIREPGIYGLTGKYKGEYFEVYNKIIESSVTDEPAEPKELTYVTFGGYTDKDNNMIELSEIVIGFSGRQNAFYQSDLTELKITCNGEAVDFKLHDSVNRYFEVVDVNNTETSFNLILVDSLTEPGDYVITGNYKGVDFTSCIITVK